MKRQFKWVCEFGTRYSVYKLAWEPNSWTLVTSFMEADPHKARKFCETIIEGQALKSGAITFYYGCDGRQLPGFDIE